MGHKTGLRESGAQGRIVPLKEAEVTAAFEDGEQIQLTDLAQAHTGEAIATLVKVMKSTKSPANAKVSAATRILEFAHGRAAQSANTGPNAGGLTINILRLSDGERVEQVIDAVDMAREMLEGERSPDPVDLSQG